MKIVILHGLGQTDKDWTFVANQFAQDVIVLDLFGNFEHEAQLSVKMLSEKVSEELKGIEEPFLLVGLSLGGFLTLDYVTKNPSDYLKGLVVCCASYKPIPQTIRFVQSMALKFVSQKEMKKLGLTKNQIIHLIDSINQIDLTEDLKEIHLPTLVVCGSKDKINLKSSKEINHSIAHSKLRMIENGQHEVNKSHPKELVDLIQKYHDELECRLND